MFANALSSRVFKQISTILLLIILINPIQVYAQNSSQINLEKNSFNEQPAAALSGYSASLGSPTPPVGSKEFVWAVNGIKPGPGQEIGTIYLSGCWKADKVANAKATDKNGKALKVTVQRGGPKVNKIQVENINDKKLPVSIQVTFYETYGSVENGTDLFVKTGSGRIAGFTYNVGGPTCGLPSNIGLSVQSGSNSITIEQGTSQNSVILINLTKAEGETVNILNTVAISPDNGGLSWVSDYPDSGYFASGSMSFVLNESFTATQPGNYIVTNTAMVQGTNIAATDTISVTVEPQGGNPVIGLVGAYPPGIRRQVRTDVIFSATIANFQSAPDYLLLKLIKGSDTQVLGELRDDGTNGDIDANDGVYSGSFSMLETEEKTVRIQATGVFPNVGERASDFGKLIVTDLPIGLQPSDPNNILTDPKTGLTFAANEVLAQFTDETSSSRRNEIASAVGGTLTGYDPGLGVNQIKLNTNTLVGINKAINHQDLATKVIKGIDTISNRDDPMDQSQNYYGHGTMVAGIAAADSNNTKGIAGIAWNSQIFALRGLDEGSSDASLASAIHWAADYPGVRVINISGGIDNDDPLVRTAVNYAVDRGCLVVAAAGNIEGFTPQGTLFYPAAYDNVFAVNASDPSNHLSTYSNKAGYVDIVAPGDGIWSTYPSNRYTEGTGTSFAAPFVSGAAAVLWQRNTSWTADQVRQRLQRTASSMPGVGAGSGLVDLFSAVFNSSFEDLLGSWNAIGTADSITSLGPINAKYQLRMGMASSGPANAQVQTILEQSFTVLGGVTQLPIKLDYNLVSEEWPEWIGRGFDDNVRIQLIHPNGQVTQLAYEDIDHSSFFLFTGLDLPGGDDTVGQTGWKTVNTVVPISGPGLYTLRIIVRDEGDGIYDSNVLVDNIRFK